MQAFRPLTAFYHIILTKSVQEKKNPAAQDSCLATVRFTGSAAVCLLFFFFPVLVQIKIGVVTNLSVGLVSL